MHRTDIYVLPKLGKCLIHEQKYSKLIAVYLFFRFAFSSFLLRRICIEACTHTAHVTSGGNRDDIDTKVVYLSIDLCFC